MAIQVGTAGNTDLRLGSTIVKTQDYAAVRSGGPLAGLRVGHWQGALVGIPATFSLNGDILLAGADAGKVGYTFASGTDSAIRIAGSGRAADQRQRPFYRTRASNDAFAGTNGAEGRATSVDLMPLSGTFFMLWGISRLEHLGTPAFYGWHAVCNMATGVVSAYVAATPIAAAWLTATSNQPVLAEILLPAFSSARSVTGMRVEQFGLFQGDFPWDTANDANIAGIGRPHFDAVRALAGFGSNPFHTYQSLITAQNAGTLGYANLSPGDASSFDYHWPLRTTTVGLDNAAGAGAATWSPFVVVDSAGIIDGADMAPAHWYPATLGALGLSAATLAQGAPATVNITGATAGSTITVSAGSLPAGLTLNSAARTITGTPTTVDNNVFTLRETLAGVSNSPRDTMQLLDIVAVPTLAALSLSATSITIGVAATINITGVTGGSALSIATGSLPPGLTLNGAARTITGTPSALGSSSFTLRETLAGATNTPRDTATSIAVAAASAVLAIINPMARFTGGRGTRATAVIGTRDAAKTVERRWVVEATGLALAGFDWATVANQSGTTWQTSDVLPVGGPYRLDVRNVGEPSSVVSSADWLVGTALLTHGQSGMERSFQRGTAPGANDLGLAVAAGAQAVLLKLNNQNAGGSASYVQPTLGVYRLRAGETPAVGQGAVALVNEWAANNPGHPVLLANMAINGAEMDAWGSNLPAFSGSNTNSQPSFLFLGTIGAQPGGSSGNDSGVTEMYAAAMGRHVDVHLFMWTPSISAAAPARAAYVAGVDARFSNATTAPWCIMPPWRGHREPPDSSSTVLTRERHVLFVAEMGSRGVLGPYWADIVMDSSQGLHSAWAASGSPSDANRVGQSRLGSSMGRAAAWVFDRTIKAHGPRVVAAWFTDGARTSIQVELGRVVRTLNGAAIANLFWISTDNGATFLNTGFTVALSADSTRAVLTSTGAAFPASNVRVDYARLWPFGPTETPDEASTERLLDGILYDDQTHRGGTNFAAGSRPGNPLSGTNRTGTGLAGVPVAARGAAKLVATERRTGSDTVTVRMEATDAATGLPVVVEKTFSVTGAAA